MMRSTGRAKAGELCSCLLDGEERSGAGSDASGREKKVIAAIGLPGRHRPPGQELGRNMEEAVLYRCYPEKYLHVSDTARRFRIT